MLSGQDLSSDCGFHAALTLASRWTAADTLASWHRDRTAQLDCTMPTKAIALTDALDALASAIATLAPVTAWAPVIAHDGRPIGYQLGPDDGLWGTVARPAGDEGTTRLSARLQQAAAWSRSGGVIGRRHLSALLASAALYRSTPAIDVAIDAVTRSQAPPPVAMVKRWADAVRTVAITWKARSATRCRSWVA